MPAASPHRVPRITVILHDLPVNPTGSGGFPTSPRLRPALEDSRKDVRTPRRRRRRTKSGRHQLEDRTWLGLLERVLQSWPITLRVVLLLAVLITGTVVIAAVLGVAGQLLLAVLGFRAQRRCQVRLEEGGAERRALERSDDA